MQSLYDSRGRHIANFVNGQLHDINGKNIGHHLENYNIFIDMRGKYLGEIVNHNRLLYCKTSSYKNMNFGVYGDYGNVGNYGNYGNIESYSFSGYDDVKL